MAGGSEQQLKLDFDTRPEAVYSVDDIYSRASAELLQKLSEDKRFERKPSNYKGERLGKYFSMWANTSPSGGIIASGMSDNGDFGGCGHLSAEALNKLESSGHVFCPDAKYTSKRIECVNNKGKPDFIVLFRVEYHPRAVAKTTKGSAFIRRSDACHKMTADEVRELAVDKGEVPFEDELCNLAYPLDFDLEAIQSWAQAVRRIMDSGHDLSDVEILANRHLGKLEADSFQANNACALLFAKDVRSLFPGCRVRFLRFDGDAEGTGEKFNAVKDIWVEGTIPSVIERAADVIKGQLRTFSPLNRDGKFETLQEYPPFAWHEAIVNACVHRSYGNGMKNINIFVRMFDSRLEIESPGPFPPYVTPENVYAMHKPRNPRIMEALFFLEIVRMNREGTRRMRDTMAEMGLPQPEFSQKEIGHSLVRVTLKNNIQQRKVWVDRDVSEVVSEALAATLTEDEKRVLNWLAENKAIQVTDVVRILSAGWGRSKSLLEDLAMRGVLQYIRFKPYEKDVRDGQAYFRLPTSEPLPEGAHIEQSKPSQQS